MRRTFSVAALVAFVGSAALLLAPPAMAQTGYPPTCNVADIPQGAGTHNVGETFQVVVSPSCVFTPGSTVAVSVNGTSVGTKTANASGFVSVTVRIVSATQLEIDDPISVVARCGANSVVATGSSQAAAGRGVTQTATFNINCGTAGGGGGSGAATSVKGSVAFTGANIAKWAAVALALIGVGAVLVVADRRRGRAKA